MGFYSSELFYYLVKIFLSKNGIIKLNTSAVDQSIEIVRKRIDETGTKEPSIIKRGSNRILVELPGIKDPERIKELLGKTAQLSFRMVTDDKTEFGIEINIKDSKRCSNKLNEIITLENKLNIIPEELDRKEYFGSYSSFIGSPLYQGKYQFNLWDINVSDI